MPDYNKPVIEKFRANQGRVSGMFANMQLLLLTTEGVKSGKVSTRPVAYTKDGNDFVVVASKGGAPTHPDWYHNMVAHPKVTIEVGDEEFEAEAHEAKGDERVRLYEQHAGVYPQFNDYKTKTDREIPVFVLKRI